MTARVASTAPEARQARETRVTHVVFDLHGGGMESLIAAMATRYAGTGLRTSVVTLSGRVGRVGTAIRPLLDDLVVLRPSRFSMLLPLELARAIRRTRADVVHLHSGSWYKGAVAARLAGVRHVIFTEHGREHFDPPLMRVLDRLAARLTTTVVAVSERLERYLHDRLAVPTARLTTIENAVDLAQFAPGDRSEALREQLGIPADAWILGSIGRMEHVKGYDRLLRVFAALRARGTARPCYLVLVGDGAERAALEALVRELGIGEHVRFPGWVESPADLYRLLDVFALTSRSEGLSVSLLEALACGTVPVVNDVGANAEILGTALRDQVVPDEAWDTFTDTVAATLADPARRVRLRAAGLERVRTRYSLDRLLEAYAALYRGGRGAVAAGVAGLAGALLPATAAD